MSNAVSTFDFTVFGLEPEEAKDILKYHCKKWCFQQEQCPSTGNVHLQGRMTLKVKKRISGVIKMFERWHISITSDANRGNYYYVMKDDTRIAGPWKDEDEEENLYIPRQVRGIQLWPWQQAVIDSAEVWDTRHIDIIVDPKGNKGKTTLATFIGSNRIGKELPYSNDFRDLMRMAMQGKAKKLYIIDIPRAINKKKIRELYAAIEKIKSGYAYDDRYKFQEKYFDCPNIWVFTNEIPDQNLLSRDRWRFWEIKDKQLVPYIQTGTENQETERDEYPIEPSDEESDIQMVSEDEVPPPTSSQVSTKVETSYPEAIKRVIKLSNGRTRVIKR